MKLRSIRRVAATTAFALLVGVAGATELAQAQRPQLPSGTLLAAGELQLAADFAAAPNQFIDAAGKMDGLNVDMCGEVAKRLGLTLKWTNLAFPGLVPGLQARRFDGLCTAIFINPQRKEIMNMVAYVRWGEGLMVRAGDPEKLGCAPTIGNDASYGECFDKLAGKAVSVAVGGTTQRNLKEHSDRLKAAGKAEITIRGFDTNADAIQAVVSGQAVAGYLNDPQAAFFVNRNAGHAIAWAGHKSNQLALATLKDNPALAQALQWALQQMKADGSYAAIIRKWGVAEVPEFAMNP
jgi:polar amino acid transport system substrate-binding protein